MSKNRSKQPDFVGIASFGFFLLLVGAIFVVTPNLLDRISDFVSDFELQEVTSQWKLPAPVHVMNHVVLYNAIFQFCLVFALFQVAVLGVRFILRDSIDKIAGTVSSVVFWFGASWILNLLISEEISRWFVFVGWLIMFVGVSLIVKSAITLTGGLLPKK